MRVLQVVTLLSPDGSYGGPARVALNQSAELLDRGHDVTVIGGGHGYRSMPTEISGVPVKLFAAKSLVPRTGFAGLTAPGLGKWLRSNWSAFDVTHVHFARDLVVLPVAALARRRGIPYLLQTHGMVVPTTHPLGGPLDGLWTRKILRDARRVFFLNKQERGQLVTVGGPNLRLVELGNGVPSYPAATPHPGPPEVLFAARIHPRKRPVAFVDMAKQLLSAGVDARFTLVGSDEGEGPALRAALAGQPRITWEGALSPDAIPARMAVANVYVLPAVREPHPMSVLEAMSVGVPVVVTTDCGLAPIVERSQCGVVADPAVPALVTAVDSILSDPARARVMGRRGRETVRMHFGMRAIGDLLLREYADIAEGRR